MDKDKIVLEITPQGCDRHLEEFGEHTTNYNILWSKNASKVALVVFTGGTDVDPALYGEKRYDGTDFSDKQRDKHEQRCFHRARELGIPMVGICRGSQFLCVMAGGKLVQDVNKHGGYHGLKTHDGRVIECNSTHHQMQRPPAGAQILAMAEPRRSDRYLSMDGVEGDEPIDIRDQMPGDVEVVYYPNIKALGVQYHPEYSSAPEECIDYYKQVVREFLFPKG